MSENNESHQAQAGAQAPRVARCASSQPLSGTEQSQRTCEPTLTSAL